MVVIRSMKSADIDQVVDVHLNSFEGFFLSFLGRDFLTQLYSSIIQDADGIAFVSEEQRVIGFVAGTAQPSNFYRRLIIHRWWRFGLASIKPVIKNPSIISRLFRALKMPQSASNEANRGSLLSIAVLPEYQGKGIGELLVKAFLDESARRGLKKVDLTTDAIDNDGVNHFYKKLGFVIERSFETPEGRSMNEYLINIL
ncbi:MAG: GNAT family N-acetyltransferase [Anaerolineaceae bacterium]